MKKFFCLILLFLSFLGFSQQAVSVNDKMFVGFQREDGIFVIYDAKGIVTIQDGFALRLETSDLKLGKFLAITDFYNTLDAARGRLGLPPITVGKIEQTSGWEKGQFRRQYGTSFNDYLNEVFGGDAVFDFRGQNINYPSYGSTDKAGLADMVVVDFPTHSIVNVYGADFKSMIEMSLYDMDNNLVWRLLDTKGGYHPCNFGNNCENKLRGNNHPDDSARWLKYGHYYLTVKNLSSDKRAIQSILWGTTYNKKFFEYDIDPGGLQTFDLYVDRLDNDFEQYKLNCNVYNPK